MRREFKDNQWWAIGDDEYICKADNGSKIYAAAYYPMGKKPTKKDWEIAKKVLDKSK